MPPISVRAAALATRTIWAFPLFFLAYPLCFLAYLVLMVEAKIRHD